MIEVSFPGGVAVDATINGRTIHTDQPRHAGGAESGPAPFDLFLVSIATCAGFYALRFCQQRGIATDGLGVTMTPHRGDKRIDTLRIDLRLPPRFPEKYREAIVRAIDQCAVKKAIIEPPKFEIEVHEPVPA
jgi:ribosomal protein S12 methylthiotransferase accessory factor